MDLLVALQRIRVSKDEDILVDLVRLQERPTRFGPETTLECGRRAMWGMMHADDARIVLWSSRMPTTCAHRVALVAQTEADGGDSRGAFDLTTC